MAMKERDLAVIAGLAVGVIFGSLVSRFKVRREIKSILEENPRIAQEIGFQPREREIGGPVSQPSLEILSATKEEIIGEQLAAGCLPNCPKCRFFDKDADPDRRAFLIKQGRVFTEGRSACQMARAAELLPLTASEDARKEMMPHILPPTTLRSSHYCNKEKPPVE